MESYSNIDSEVQQPEGAGILDLDFSATGSQIFPSQPVALNGANPSFHAPDFCAPDFHAPEFHTPDFLSQTRGYEPRSCGYQGFPRSVRQAHDAGRNVNIVLPNGGTDSQSLLILSSNVERLGHEIQVLKRAVMRFQDETKASLESVKDGLNNFMNSIMAAYEKPGETPVDAPGGGAAQMS